MNASPPTFHAWAYPPAGRLVVAVLLAIGIASVPAILAVVLLANDPPVTPGDVVRLVRDLTLLPWGLGWLVRHAFRAEVAVTPAEPGARPSNARSAAKRPASRRDGVAGPLTYHMDTPAGPAPCAPGAGRFSRRTHYSDGLLVIARAGVRLEVPLAAIARVRPWRVPLPAPGVTVYLRGGRRLQDGGLALRDPSPLLAALAGAGVAAARTAAADPAIVWAEARAARPRRRWYHWVLKFPLFALLPTAVLFNLHQHIAHGGPLGEYYLLGPWSYAHTFLIYYVTLTIYLALYAGTWRGLAEVATRIATGRAPARAATWRRAAERVCALAYWAGVPALLALRLLPG